MHTTNTLQCPIGTKEWCALQVLGSTWVQNDYFPNLGLGCAVLFWTHFSLLKLPRSLEDGASFGPKKVISNGGPLRMLKQVLLACSGSALPRKCVWKFQNFVEMANLEISKTRSTHLFLKLILDTERFSKWYFSPFFIFHFLLQSKNAQRVVDTRRYTLQKAVCILLFILDIAECAHYSAECWVQGI